MVSDDLAISSVMCFLIGSLARSLKCHQWGRFLEPCSSARRVNFRASRRPPPPMHGPASWQMLSSKSLSPASAASSAARPLSSTATHPALWRTTPIVCHGNASSGGAEHLQGGLLGGEAGGETLGDDALGGVAVAQLALGVDALEVAIAMLVDRCRTESTETRSIPTRIAIRPCFQIAWKKHVRGSCKAQIHCANAEGAVPSMARRAAVGPLDGGDADGREVCNAREGGSQL